jgi:PAS domain S-box-containing protein
MRAIPDLPVSNPAGFVLHVLTDGVLTHDLTGRIVQWNEAAPKILRVADDALGASSTNPLWHAVHADGSPWPIETQPAQLTVYQGIQVHDETMGIRQPDGTFMWLRVNAYPTHDDEGVVDGATTIFNDITDIFERATSQQASQRRFLTTFERSPVGSLIVDPDGSLVAVNLAFATLIGRRVAEIRRSIGSRSRSSASRCTCSSPSRRRIATERTRRRSSTDVPTVRCATA